MDDLLRQATSYARGAWAQRWWGLLAAWVLGVALAVVVYVLPDNYQASARIYVDTQSLLAPLMQGLAVPSDVNQQVSALSSRLISRPNVEKLIRMADLDLKVQDPKARDRLIESVTKRLRIQSTGRDNLYTLSFTDGQPEQAKRVVQSLVSIFVESGLGDKRQDSDSARRFIEEQIKIYAQKLDEAEARLKEFKLKNLSMLGDAGKDSLGQMGEVMGVLRQAQLELREVENSREALRRQLAGEEPVLLPTTQNDSSLYSIPELDGRIDSLKKTLDEALRRYTDKHPDVIATRSMITQLEAQRAEEVKARRKVGGPAISANNNPVYQQIKLALSDAEARAAALRTRVAEYESRAAQIRQFMKLGPQIEQEYAQLNRDYDINKRNYEGLVARRESANMSVELGAANGVAEFRLIDPPSVPSKPSAPNRALLMPAAGVIAILFGLALAVLVAQFRPVFYDARALRELTGLPILGTVSLSLSLEQRRRERRANWAFAAGFASLLASFAGMTLLVTLIMR